MKQRKFVRIYYYNEELWYVNTKPKSPLLNIELLGITHADPTYHINRENEWDMYIIEYILSGKGYIHCNGHKYEVSAGDAYIIRNFTKHEYYADPGRPYEKVWVNVSGALLDHLLPAFQLGDAVTVRHTDLKEHFDTLRELLAKEYDEEAIAGVLLRMIYQFANNYSILQDKNLSLAEKIRQYIEKNIGNDISTETVADFFHLSPVYANRAYKAKYQETIKQTINENRLQLAAQWLKTSDYSIGEISDRLGFCNDNYFAACFKKHFGLSPKQYQIKNQRKNLCNTPEPIDEGGDTRRG